jgi:rubredoxin
MEVNFNCGSCKTNYDIEVGEPSMDGDGNLLFEHNPVCPTCRIEGKELLSELGQSQMTEWHLGDLDFDL